jgi:hypothetical protein
MQNLSYANRLVTKFPIRIIGLPATYSDGAPAVENLTLVNAVPMGVARATGPAEACRLGRPDRSDDTLSKRSAVLRRPGPHTSLNRLTEPDVPSAQV